MDDYRQIIPGAKPGEIIPIAKEIDMEETVDLFATKISAFAKATVDRLRHEEYRHRTLRSHREVSFTGRGVDGCLIGKPYK